MVFATRSQPKKKKRKERNQIIKTIKRERMGRRYTPTGKIKRQVTETKHKERVREIEKRHDDDSSSGIGGGWHLGTTQTRETRTTAHTRVSPDREERSARRQKGEEYIALPGSIFVSGLPPEPVSHLC